MVTKQKIESETEELIPLNKMIETVSQVETESITQRNLALVLRVTAGMEDEIMSCLRERFGEDVFIIFIKSTPVTSKLWVKVLN